MNMFTLAHKERNLLRLRIYLILSKKWSGQWGGVPNMLRLASLEPL